MHPQDRIPHGNGFMGALTRQILLPPHRPAAPFRGGYGSIPRREGNWGGVRGEHQSSPQYMSDSLIVPDGDRSIIPPRFEHRMSKESIEEQNWRFPQDRSVSLHELSVGGRSVYRQSLPGLKTADLSHRLRHSPRGNKKPIFINQSSPRPFPHTAQRTDKKLSAKDRLSLPTQTQGEKRTEPRINRKGIHISKHKNKTALPVKSSTQNDPRIRNDSNLKSDIPNEPRMASIDKYVDNLIDSLSPIKSPVQYFDEDSSLKKEMQTEIHQTFDVPLPPLASPKQNNQQTEITKDSFWDETEDCLPETKHIPFTQKNHQSIFNPVNSHSIETHSDPSEPMECSQSVSFNYFDDEISSNFNQPKPTSLVATNKKQNHPHRNAIKQRRDEKLKKYPRKEMSNEQKKPHSKRSHLKLNSHKPNHVQPTNANSHIIKLITQSHIRLKKTVNLADQESEHSSSEEETDIPVPNNMYIPLPTSPLQPLHIETPKKLHSNDISNDFSGQIDFASIQTQEIANLCTRDDTAIGLAVEVEGSPFINKPTETTDIHEILEQRQLMLSESSDIGLHIEYVSDDVISKSPVGFNVEISTEIPKITELPSLFIPNSPKCETPDSVFTPGFGCSQLPKTFSVESIDSLAQSVGSSVVENESVNSEKHKRMQRKSNRKSRKYNPNNESDHSFNNTREVCIPITKLNVRHYGAKPRASSLNTLNGRETQNSKLVPTCMFCHRAANDSNLGFLYGPYEGRGNSLSLTHANRVASKEFDKNEMWVHAPCALYSPGVHLLAFQLDGLVDAYDTSREARCEECGETGATLSCQAKSCTRVYHYACADTSSSSLNDSLQLLCPLHTTTDTTKDL